MFNSMDSLSGVARIKVIGVGRRGQQRCQPHDRSGGITSANYVAVNTDKQILLLSKAESKIQIGSALTKGLGAGAEPEVGRAAAEESKEGAHRGGQGYRPALHHRRYGRRHGHGRCARPSRRSRRDLKILTIAVVTEPFTFEGKKAHGQHREGPRKPQKICRYPHRHPERQDHRRRSQKHADERGAARGGRSAQTGHPRHRRPHRQPRPHQPRLRRRAHHPQGPGSRAHGRRRGEGRKTGSSRPSASRSTALCSKRPSRARRASSSTSSAATT